MLLNHKVEGAAAGDQLSKGSNASLTCHFGSFSSLEAPSDIYINKGLSLLQEVGRNKISGFKYGKEVQCTYLCVYLDKKQLS